MLDFNKEYILENQVARLTPLVGSDYNNLVEFSLNEPDLWTYSLTQPNTEEKLKVYIDTALRERENKNTYAFTVFDKRKNKYAGCTRYYNIQPNDAILLIGYTWYGKDFQGTGLNKNCKYLMLEFAFETMKMERVEFRADFENQRSINALKSIGCTVEGVLRSHSYKTNGERRDTIVLSILKNEWEKTIKNELLKHVNLTDMRNSTDINSFLGNTASVNNA